MSVGEAMNHAIFHLCSAFLLSASVSACGGSTANPTNKPFDVVLHATGDDGEPVAGARFLASGASIGESDNQGRVATTLRGADGQNLAVTVQCPDGYAGPEQPSWLKLTELRRVDQTGPATLGIDVTCVRKLREIVVVVRTANAPSLPVDVGGKTVGNTDTDGNAHIRLLIDREVRALSVSLGTSAAPALRPQNPSRVFDLDGQDAMLLLDQTFSMNQKRFIARRVSSASSPPQHVPYRIGSGR